MLQSARDYAAAHQADFVEQLLGLLRIPSISKLNAHKADVRRAAHWLVDELNRIGLEHVQILETAGHPVVYADWLHAGESAPTVLIYGHYDVQPVDPLEAWTTPPFEPEVRDGRIYGRGASDDKGQLFMHLKALESMLVANGNLPVNVKLLLEGEEEDTSPNLPPVLIENRELFAADHILISDTAFLEPGQPLIPYGLRGIAGVEIKVSGPKTDLHSGAYGGTVNNPLHVVARIIAAMHDDGGRVQVPGFYDNVRQLSQNEREQLAKVPYTLDKWQQQTGLQHPWGEADFSLLERIGARPTVEVNGMWGGYQGEGNKTIIPSEASAKFTMRLVPDQDPAEITTSIIDFIKQLTPEHVDVSFKTKTGAKAVLVPLDAPELQAATRAYQAVWGAAPFFSLGGGSIPVVEVLQRTLNVPVVLMGFGLPGSNIHAPDEWFSLEQFEKGIQTILYYCHELIS